MNMERILFVLVGAVAAGALYDGYSPKGYDARITALEHRVQTLEVKSQSADLRSVQMQTPWGGDIVITVPTEGLVGHSYQGLDTEWCARLAATLPGAEGVKDIKINGERSGACGKRPDNRIEVWADRILGDGVLGGRD